MTEKEILQTIEVCNDSKFHLLDLDQMLLAVRSFCDKGELEDAIKEHDYDKLYTDYWDLQTAFKEDGFSL